MFEAQPSKGETSETFSFRFQFMISCFKFTELVMAVRTVSVIRSYTTHHQPSELLAHMI